MEVSAGVVIRNVLQIIFFEKSFKIHGKIPVLESLLMKFQALRLAALLKSDSSKGVFL